jgi:predicted enzyme related to lactoylglutathione lyase
MSTPKHNAVSWFEIPVLDMKRAMNFYETVFECKLDHKPMGELEMAWFPMSPSATGAAGALMLYPQWYKPAMAGVLVYFTAGSGDVAVELERAVQAGGKVLVPKKSIGQYGHTGVFADTEGNRIGVHSLT